MNEDQKKLIEELELRLSQQSTETSGGMIHSLYLKSIKDIIERLKAGVYKPHDPMNSLKRDLQRCGFFDLANQILTY